jgi:DNA-binding LacI/PurR family transcriptional regulator
VNDVEAANALAAIERHGLRPGRDVAVVGFDDSPVAAFVGGGLTSVRQPLNQVATELIRVLADQFDDPHAKPEGVLLKPELITRRSTSRE